jgi:DNA processing protein
MSNPQYLPFIAAGSPESCIRSPRGWREKRLISRAGIATEFLVISQVPVHRYESQDYRRNRLFFPERNITMSALTEATLIVEAGETSGTLTQARAAIQQKRKLFILDNCFRNKNLTWPQRFEQQGGTRVTRVVDYNDIRAQLAATTH